MDLLPNVQVVADTFHVTLQVNKELDTQIKREIIQARDLEKTTKLRSKKAEYQQNLEGLKKSKYSFFKNEQDLNEKQKIKLLPVKTVYPTLKIMHELKEVFRQIFDKTTNWLKALFKLGQWHKRAQKYFQA
jgi:transposase